MTQSVNACTRYWQYKGFEFLSPSWTAHLRLSIHFLGFFTALVMKSRINSENVRRGRTVNVRQKSVCQRVSGYTVYFNSCSLTSLRLDKDLDFTKPKLLHKGSAEREVQYLLRYWIYNCHILTSTILRRCAAWQECIYLSQSVEPEPCRDWETDAFHCSSQLSCGQYVSNTSVHPAFRDKYRPALQTLNTNVQSWSWTEASRVRLC